VTLKCLTLQNKSVSNVSNVPNQGTPHKTQYGTFCTLAIQRTED
jgi:hypothetical protein